MKDEQLFGICLSFESKMAIEEPPPIAGRPLFCVDVTNPKRRITTGHGERKMVEYKKPFRHRKPWLDSDLGVGTRNRSWA